MRRSPAVISISLLVTLGVAGCGSGSSTNAHGATNLSDYRLVSAAAGKTQAARTARIAITARFSRIPDAGSMTMTASGVLDMPNRAAAISARMPLPQQTFTMRMVVQDQTMYMQLPEK